MIGHAGSEEAADQIARHVAGDVGGERGGRVRGAVMLAEISQGEGKGRRHAQALHDARAR